MRKRLHTVLPCAVACAAILAAPRAHGHGFVGDRFFPPTIATDDPSATDELLFPSISEFKNPAADGTPQTRVIDYGFEFDKQIFPHFALGIADDYLSQKPKGGRAVNGWDDLTLSAKYELWANPQHEAIISVGLISQVGGSGTQNVGDSFTTFTPTFYFGKGFGDLPDSLWGLQPLAVTGTLGQTLMTGGSDPNAFQWGLAVEYSLPYLQQHVRDVGLPAPFKDMIPLVEFPFQTTENRGQAGLTTGTINPGVLWETHYYQLGVEAMIPVNRLIGSHVGVIFQLEIYIDDIFPKVFGPPIFGEEQ